MNYQIHHTRRLSLLGPVGMLEMLEDSPVLPEGALPRGVAVVAHPHPLFGGSMDNKVVQTLARAFAQCGWRALRFNFRGVGASEGTHDHGRGELQDLLAVVDHGVSGEAGTAPLPLALAGFSFGAAVVSRSLESLVPQRAPRQLVLVGTAVEHLEVAAVPKELHARTLVLHGEQDDTVPLASVLDWARPQSLPITVIPGASHFFHGQLLLLRSLVVRHLAADDAHHS
ncbi:MAG: alpha/beta hydrolase [Rhodoferax sp.]|nr:alpha/beta hydrolase [Rhodoferax sp.]